MTARKLFETLKEYIILSFGTLMYCLAWESFLIPNNVASGGLTGLCTIIQFATQGFIPVSYSFIVLNVILLAIAFLA